MRQQGGFTLLEVLAALVLSGMILGLAYSGLSASISAVDRGQVVIDQVNRVRLSQEFLRRQFSRITPIAYDQDEREGVAIVFEGSSERVRFVAPMPGYLAVGGNYVQTLELERDRDGLALTFQHRLLNLQDPEEADEAEPVLLLDRIQRGGFKYLYWDAEREELSWVEEWENPGITPAAVRLDLELEGSVWLRWPSLEVPLMLDGSGAGLQVLGGFRRPGSRPQPEEGIE